MLIQVEESVVYRPIGEGYSTIGTLGQSRIQADNYLRRIRIME